jgi:uncharacterized protein YndB with AHSA1/START domain
MDQDSTPQGSPTQGSASPSSPAQGRITHESDGYSIRFERPLHHPVEKVWAAISDPVTMALWLAPAQIELTVGGYIQLEFSHAPSVCRGRIVELIPFRVLAYTWKETGSGTSLVRWELKPEKYGCLLVLTHSQLPEDVPSFAAGWHTHLDLLAETVDGLRHSFTWEEQWWKSKLSLYEL